MFVISTYVNYSIIDYIALIKFSNTAEVRDPSLKFIPVYRADFVEGSYVKTNYNIGDICNFTITKDASWSYKIVDCTKEMNFIS